jgi:hypothetical protein
VTAYFESTETDCKCTTCLQACEEPVHQKGEPQGQRWKSPRTSGPYPATPRSIK